MEISYEIKGFLVLTDGTNQWIAVKDAYALQPVKGHPFAYSPGYDLTDEIIYGIESENDYCYYPLSLAINDTNKTLVDGYYLLKVVAPIEPVDEIVIGEPAPRGWLQTTMEAIEAEEDEDDDTDGNLTTDELAAYDERIQHEKAQYQSLYAEFLAQQQHIEELQDHIGGLKAALQTLTWDANIGGESESDAVLYWKDSGGVYRKMNAAMFEVLRLSHLRRAADVLTRLSE